MVKLGHFFAKWVGKMQVYCYCLIGEVPGEASHRINGCINNKQTWRSTEKQNPSTLNFLGSFIPWMRSWGVLFFHDASNGIKKMGVATVLILTQPMTNL